MTRLSYDQIVGTNCVRKSTTTEPVFTFVVVWVCMFVCVCEKELVSSGSEAPEASPTFPLNRTEASGRKRGPGLGTDGPPPH